MKRSATLKIRYADLLKHLIVGIDAGKTAALACLDLEGKVVNVATGRFVGLEWFVSAIKDTGSPVIIASDKRKPDSLSVRLSTIFDAVLFAPETDMSVEKKKVIASKFASNFHERDALAAATTAYNVYVNKLRQAERMAKENNTDADRVKAMVIKRYSVYEAVNKKISGRRFAGRKRAR